MDNIKKLKSKSSTKSVYFDIISEGEATHTLFNSDFKKVTSFTIGEWYNGISDLYEVISMKPEEQQRVMERLYV